MRFSVEAAALKRAFSLVNPVLPRKGFTPMIENVLLRLEGDTLLIAANDLDHAARLSLPVTGEANGETTVNGMRLKGIADTAPPGAQISLAAETGTPGADIRCGRSRFRLATLPVKDFPEAAGVDGLAIELAPGQFERLLSAGVCTSFEETRYYLNGIFLHRKGQTLCATATDGHKLAHVPVPLPAGGEGMADRPDDGAGYILPNEVLRHLAAMVGERGCRLTLADKAIEVAVAFGNELGPLVYRTKLVDGQFPTYSRVIPARKNFGASALVDVARFRAALTRCAVSLTAVEAARKPREIVALNFSDGLLRFETEGDFGESASDEIDIEWTGGEMRAGFNWRYLDAIAEAVGGSRIRFFPSPDGPARFEAEADDGRIYVVMPMRL